MADNFNSETQEIKKTISETTDSSTFQDSVNMKDEKLKKIQEFVKKDGYLVEESLAENSKEFGNTKLPRVNDIIVADDEESTKKLNVGISGFGVNQSGIILDGESLNNLVGVSENSKRIQEFSNTHLPKLKDNGFLNGEMGKSMHLEDKCTLKIEVIDDTAMIHISQLGNKRFVNTTKNKRVYSRKELEDLRYIGMEQQKKTWVQVYCGLSDVVRKEYDGLLYSNDNQKARRHRGKENTPNLISGNDPFEHLDDQEGNIDTRNSPLALPLRRDDGISYEEGESNVYEESDDDDYSSIQRPAFKVTGEPDFNSGPPEDGLEYLRRVRWEAAQFPKVKVVKVECSKLNKEQTRYMPQIPDIASCPEHLLPLKEWEESFLADFSELRQALSRLEADVGTSSQLHSATFVHQQHSNQLPEGIVLDKFDGLMSGENESCLSDAGDDPALGNSTPKSSPAGGVGNIPTLSVILRMDAVARVSMLRKRITAVQSMSSLSRDDCLWLFVLCSAVDTPLDADTCAALRSLLRKCASLRAEKSELDDEVIMLNILATISGRYFGQSEQ